MDNGTPSLLLALLRDIEGHHGKYSDNESVQKIVEANIDAVIQAVKPPPGQRQPNLIKDVAQKKLYEVLYDIIEKEYEEPQEAPKSEEDRQKAQENRIFNGAIGMALELVLQGNYASGSSYEKLREKLRAEIIKALIPK